MASATDSLEFRVHHAEAAPVIVYLPGLHGDWTLLPRFRQALAERAGLVELSYASRTSGSPDEYAREILGTLHGLGVKRGWLLGESFGSQVAWSILAQTASNAARRSSEALTNFEPEGLILAGGFVQHPIPWGVALAHRVSCAMPMWMLRGLIQGWALWARRRCAGHPESVEGIREFVARRTTAADRAAINARYRMILQSDPCTEARSARCPVFHLTGLIDPIVPWPPVRRWLRANCPAYRETRILRRAGHAVLLDAPAESAEQILRWIRA